MLLLIEPIGVASKMTRQAERYVADTCCFVDGVLYRLYLLGNLRKRSSFRDLIVVPTVLRLLVTQACNNLPASGGYLAFKASYDRIRDRCWWPAHHSKRH